MSLLRFFLITLLGSSLCNCTITTVNIPQKTALENQLIGEMAPLSEEELLLASVRSGENSRSASIQPVVAARRRQLFNRDDIVEFKQGGCLGESQRAALVALKCNRDDASSLTLIAKLVEQENADRNTLITWFITRDPTLAPTDRDQVVQIYHQLLLKQSPVGTPIQEEENSWNPKKGKTE